MKIQRSTGVNGMKSRTQDASIRVVPPIFWPLEIMADFKGFYVCQATYIKPRDAHWRARKSDCKQSLA